MKIGLLTLQYRLIGINSLKEKRSIVKRLLGNVEGCGPAYAAAEVACHDSLRRMTIRVAHLSNDHQYTDFVLSRLRERLSKGCGYEAIDASIEDL